MKKTTIATIAAVALLAVSAGVAIAYLQIPQSPANAGQLSIFGTDPPVAASGVTYASVHYSSVAAHTAGSDMASGWTQVSGSGTLQLTGSAGAAQNLATSNVSAGAYDAFRFNVDSAKVTYQGRDYVATVASSTITAQSQNRVQVVHSAKAAAVVDLKTFLINTGTNSSPQFIFSASAAAQAIPSSALASLNLNVGSTATLSTQAWWSDFVASTTADVSLVSTVSGSSMTVNAVNTGSAKADIQEIIVTPISLTATASGSLPSSFTGSAVFTVNGTGTVQSTTSLQSTALLNAGASLASGASTTLSFNGNIQTNFGLVSVQLSGIVTGQEYLVTVIGANTYASTVVVAG